MQLSRIRPSTAVQLVAGFMALCVLALNPALLRSDAGWLGVAFCTAILFDLTASAWLAQRLFQRTKHIDPLPVFVTGTSLAVLLLPAVRPLALGGLILVSLAWRARTLRQPGHPWTMLLNTPWARHVAGPEEVLLTTHLRGNWATYVWMYLLMDVPLHVLLAFTGLGWVAALDLLNVAGMALLARSFKAYPCLLNADRLLIRMGALSIAECPLANIQAVLAYTPALRGRTLVVITPPNVTLCLNTAVLVRCLFGSGRGAKVLHLYLDNPATLRVNLRGC